MEPNKVDWFLVAIIVIAFLFVVQKGHAESLSPLMAQTLPTQPNILPQNNFDGGRLAVHFAASYALTSLTYIFVTKRLGWDPIPSFIFAAMLTSMAGVMYEASETTGPQNDNLGRSVLYNTMGIAGAGLTFTALSF